MGVTILIAGLIPILWTMTGTTRRARITVNQVQGTSHAANLLEAVRAAGFDLVKDFPPVMMEQGSKGAASPSLWGPPPADADLSWAGLGAAPPGEVPEAQEAFKAFTDGFFDADKPVVPPMEAHFKRYLVIRGAGTNLLGVIVRVEWNLRSPDEDPTNHVELRTVIANPFRT